MSELQNLTSEVEKVSQLYTGKFNIERDGNWFVLKLQEELGELIQAYLMMTGKARTKDQTPEEINNNFKDEVADVFSHVLLLANFYNIDLEKAVEEKWLKWSK